MSSGPHATPRPTGPRTDAEAEAWRNDEETLSLPPPPTGMSTPDGANRSEPTTHRDDIVIPDYTLLKRIGSGAYGEVWLAQSVTGALRAVKIVWREDFDLTRTFHREFLGIQQFEPISRGHPCLVHILHVGWNEERGFYYCVMELGDDAEDGPQFDEIDDYVPRTLGTDMKRHGRLDLTFCRDAGVYLADALHYMHTHGLTHRDIKPSNIIFVDGVCKLADIGLVAGFGERTYVGTEGFVPPEGPGTPPADIYSLGKVIYEMSSGNDRMEFPEVPKDLTDDEWHFWMDLNRVICRACAPDLKERFSSADQFAEALQAVGQPQPEGWFRRFARAAIFTTLFSAIAAGGLVTWKYQKEWSLTFDAPRKSTNPKPGPRIPIEGRPWRNHRAQWFTWVKDRHLSDQPVDAAAYGMFLEATQRASEFEVIPTPVSDNRTLYAVIVPKADAGAFCAWMTQAERLAGRLDRDHEYSWRSAPLRIPEGAATPREGWSALQLQVVPVPYGLLEITTIPRGAEVFRGPRSLGRTPLTLDKVRAGNFALEVRMTGYEPTVAKGQIKLNETKKLNLRLRATDAAVFDKPWENSLGIKMAPMGRVMIATVETRRKDFIDFARAVGIRDAVGDFATDGDLPVTNVNRTEAVLFCRWLTDRERTRGLLEPEHAYRLPTDDEWSMAAYLPREKGASPSERSGRIGGIYPWGFTWPPLPKPGNFLDQSADPDSKTGIAGYDDGFPGLAPVGSFKPDSRGLSDLSGNVWEWVADAWEDDFGGGVIRGGSFRTREREELLASHRRSLDASAREPDVGFRVVLSVLGEVARGEE
jgi:serine/threonine protein kinase